MRIFRQIAVIIRLLACFVVAVVAAVSYAQESTDGPATIRAGRRTYDVLEKSPNGRYALVWGLRSGQINFKKLESDYSYGERVLSYDYRVRNVLNCIIDCKTHTVVTTIPEFHHVPQLNHSDISTLWGSQAGFCLVFLDGKWRPEGFCLIGLSGANRGRRTQFLEAFRRSVGNYFHKATLQPRRALGDGLMFHPSLDKGNRLTLAAYADVPKAISGWAFESTLSYTVTADGRFVKSEPTPIGHTWAYETPPNNDDGKSAREGRTIVAGFQGSAFVWRYNVVPQVKRGVLQRVKDILPKTFLNASPPHVEIAQVGYLFPGPGDTPRPRPRAKQLDVHVSVCPNPNDPTWYYDAIFTYNITVKQPGAFLKRVTVTAEETMQSNKKTRELGILDFPLERDAAPR